MYRYAGYRVVTARTNLQASQRKGAGTPEAVLAEVELGQWEARRTAVLAQFEARGLEVPKPKSQEVRKPRKKHRAVKVRARAVPPEKPFPTNTLTAKPTTPTIQVDLPEPSDEHIRAAREQLHRNQKFYPKGGRFRSKNSLWSTYDESASTDPDSIYVAPSDPTP